MNEDHILTVAESLEQVNPDNFHMPQWLRTEDYPTAPRFIHSDHLQHIHDLMPCSPLHRPSALMRAAQDCGTRACAAVWTVILLGAPEGLREHNNQVSGYAADLLGINDADARRLFLPIGRNVNYGDLTPRMRPTPSGGSPTRASWTGKPPSAEPANARTWVPPTAEAKRIRAQQTYALRIVPVQAGTNPQLPGGHAHAMAECHGIIYQPSSAGPPPNPHRYRQHFRRRQHSVPTIDAIRNRQTAPLPVVCHLRTLGRHTVNNSTKPAPSHRPDTPGRPTAGYDTSAASPAGLPQ